MFVNKTEAAYCVARIARSTALALASTNSCARASHVGIADEYKKRLAALGTTQVARPIIAS